MEISHIISFAGFIMTVLCTIGGTVWIFAKNLRELETRETLAMETLAAKQSLAVESLSKRLDDTKEYLRLYSERVVETETNTRKTEYGNLDTRLTLMDRELRRLETSMATRDDVKELSNKMERLGDGLAAVPLLGLKLDNLLETLGRVESRIDKMESNHDQNSR
jgi:predicted transcriptional regulator